MAKNKSGIPQPSVEDINDLVAKNTDLYSDLHRQFEADETFYELAFGSMLNLPEEHKNMAIVLPTARELVDTFTDHVDVTNARVFVNKKGESGKDEETAEMERKFGLGLIYRTNVEAPISPWRDIAKHVPLYGVGIMRDLYVADMWPMGPERDEDESDSRYNERVDEWRYETSQTIPIDIQAINPHNVMFDLSYGPPQYVIESHERLCIDVSRQYPSWGNPKGRKNVEKVDVISYFDKEWRCFLVDGEPTYRKGTKSNRSGVIRHGYGFLPYVIFDSGLGNHSYDNDISKRYVGVLRYLRDVLVSESRNYSVMDIITAKNAWPAGIIKGPGAANVQNLKLGFGDWTALPTGVELEELQPKMSPSELVQHFMITRQIASDFGSVAALKGLSQEGVRSGADRRLTMSEAVSRMRYAETAFRYKTAQVLTNCARLFKNVIPGDVRVWQRTPTDEFDAVIKKDKMKEPFNYYVEFAPISEEDEYRRHDDLERLYTSGITTKQWARKQMSNVDPEAMEREEMRAAIAQSPMVLQIKDQYVAEELMKAIQKRQMAEGIVAGGIPVTPGLPTGGGQPLGAAPGPQPGTPPTMPGGLVPPVPNRAAPGSAGDMQNQLQGMRRPTPINQQGQGGGGARGATR